KLSREDEGQIRIQLWGVANGTMVSSALDTKTTVMFEIALSPDGLRAVTVEPRPGMGARLNVWVIAEARVSFQAPVSPEVTLARFSADGAFLAATDLTGTARIWDAASGNEIVSVRHAPPVRHLAFSTNNRFLITGGLDGIARVWRLPSGALTAELKHGPALTHAIDQVAFSSDGRNDALVVGID